MTSNYDASDVVNSFEDLSSLSSNKNIESLVLATTYSDDDDDDLRKNTKSTDNNSLKANGAEKKEEDGNYPTKVDDDDDDGFVDLVGADVEDEEDVLSEGWESSRSTPPEPQCAHQDLSIKPASPPKNQASNRLHQDDDTDNSNDKKDPIATTKAKANTNYNINLTSTSSIPRIKTRMTKDILAALNKPNSSGSVAIASSPPLDRVVVTPSRLRLARQKAANKATSATATATTPDDASVPSPQTKQIAKPKKTVPTKHLVASTVDQPAAPTATVEPSVSLATGAASTTTDKPQLQEQGDGICKAIRLPTGRRCTRYGRHDGYCSMHRFLAK